MSIKIIAIGNVLMGDDGIGIKVAEKIRSKINYKKFELIIGETDFEYCISMINEGDTVVIIDAAIFNKALGALTIIPITNFKQESNCYSQHSFSLSGLLNLYFKHIKGFIIGIEVENVSYSYKLSYALQEKLDMISQDVYRIIETLEI
jgi:hydrogenase maturation protease